MKRRVSLRAALFVLAAALVSLLLVHWGGSQSAEGFPSYLSAFTDRYPAASGTALDDCTTCHEVPGGPRNPYGQAVEAQVDAGKDIDEALAAIEAEDSDGDGASNLEEISAGTFPGDATSSPPPAAPSLEAASATITVDGDNSDWAGIDGLAVTIEQPDYAGTDFPVPDAVGPIDTVVKVAVDDQNIYVLWEVTDDYDFGGTKADGGDHHLSAALAVMWLIDPAAGPHMGADDPDFETGLGMVDIWHWEIDCAAGELSGGGDPGSGDDPDCNLDDEYSTDPLVRKDDGGGTPANPDGENSITGVWEHTGRAGGNGTAGTWIFEFSRPLQTGDPQDAQFAAGGTALMALAYWDADETAEGWTGSGHLTSADAGWIQVTLPAAATPTPPAVTPTPPAATPTPAATATPAAPPPTGGSPDGDDGVSAGIYLLVALGGLAALTGVGAIARRVYRRRA